MVVYRFFDADCTPATRIALMVEPRRGSPSLNAQGFLIIQDGVNYPAIAREENGEAMLGPTGYIRFGHLEHDESRDPGGAGWNSDAEFQVWYQGAGDPDIDTLPVGGYDGSPFAVDGRASAAYYDPARNGEGIMLFIDSADEATKSGFTGFLSWFTYREGGQFWMIGVGVSETASDSAVFTLYETDGTGFGDQFHSDEVTEIEWGSGTMWMPFCGTLVFDYQGLGGEQGRVIMMPIVTVSGLACDGI